MSQVISRSERSLIFKEQLPDDKQVVWKLCSPSNSTVAELANEFDITSTLEIDSVRKPFKKSLYENKEAFAYYHFEGDSLKRCIGNGRLSLNTFLNISINIVTVIKQLHNAGILHLRLNSNNILVNVASDEICIIDFSLASPNSKAKPVQFRDWGSELAYISPEQTGYLHQTIDERSDLYSFGIVLYEMLAGEPPFSSNDSAAVVHDHLIKIPKSIKDIRDDIPVVISAIVDKLLVKKQENRYQTAEGLAYDLQKCYQLFKATQTVSSFQLGLQDEQPLKLTDSIIGREQVLASLSHELQQAMQGQSRLCLISGEQGAGKTAVVELFGSSIRNKNGIVISGKSIETAVNLPFSAVVDALKDFAAFILSQGENSSIPWKLIVTEAVGENASFLVDFIPEYKWIIKKNDETGNADGGNATGRTDFCSLVLKILKEVAVRLDFVVVFIDDLQWTDPDSWKCIRSVVSDEELQKFLLVGTYRKAEKEQLLNTLQNVDYLTNLKKEALNIALCSFNLTDTATFLSASRIQDDGEQLSRLLLSRTLGNPFFLRQFLQTLYRGKILRYNRTTQTWVADSNAAENVQITDNVINYISLRVKDLPSDAQDVLLFASCIGSVFDVETLEHITSKERYPVTELLHFLKEEGFIAEKEKSIFYFVHDRIRKAAYEMIPTDQQALIHYKTAIFLHSKKEVISPAKNFTIASHYNIGHDYIPEKDFFTVAELNMKAGLQAKQSAAFELSYEYLKAAIRLLKPGDWNKHYETVLTIYNEATEVAMIAGAYKDAEAWLKASLEHAANIEDRIKAHDVKLNHLSETHRFEEAIDYLLQVLDEIGYGIKRHPGRFTIFREFIKVKWFLRNKKDETILNLQPLTNERAKAFVKLTVNALSSIFGTAPDILPVVIFRQAWLSLKYGNSVYSPYAYVSYGFAVSAFMNDLKRGYQFGQLALQLADKLNADIIKAKVLVVFHGFISYFIDPLRKSLAPLKEAYSIGRKTGDLQYAAFALAFRNEVSLHCGENLTDIFSSVEQDCNTVKEMNQDLVFRILTNQLQLIYQLSHPVKNPLVLQYNLFDETAYLNQLIEAKDNASIFNFYFSKLFLACTFNKMDEAFECYDKARKYEEETTARQIFYGAFLMYSAMAEIKKITKNTLGKLDKIIKIKLKSLQRFAHFAPVNYAGKLSFLYALAEETKGNTRRAEAHFQQSIQHSQKNAFIHEEALAREHLAYLYFKTGNGEYAEAMIQKAYTCYQRWGAVSKCDQLKEAFREVLNKSVAEGSEMNIASFQNMYDLNTVINANKALSSENSLEGLLKRFLEIVVQNASADKAIVILKTNQGQTAKAIGSNEGISMLEDANASGENVFPVALVNFVAQTSAAYSSDNLSSDKRFNYDDYIVKQHPVSACCIPICTKTAYLGAIYLENNFAEAVFGAGKVEFFKTIASQLAISLENVSLLADMEQKVKEKTSQLTISLQELKAAQAQLVQQEKMSYLGELTAGIAHEIQNPLNFVNNFSEVSSELLTEMSQELTNGAIDEAKAIAEDVKQNLEKINYHGKRADAIVKSMLQHSRRTTGQKELTDINVLCDEYIRLSYHGLRAKDKSFSAAFTTDFDTNIGKINLIPQDISRVLLNLLNNAFYAVGEKQKTTTESFRAVVSIQTKLEKDNVHIIVTDNGNGIPHNVIDKIFQPFFTTKPTGQGTGLGLSLSYDIIKAHGGKIIVESKEGEGSIFTVQLPVS